MSRILIIEDEPAIRRVLVKILSEEDKSHEIDEAENGIEAINHIKKNSYDLIISDIKMPKVDGMEVLDFSKKKHTRNSNYHDFWTWRFKNCCKSYETWCF